MAGPIVDQVFGRTYSKGVSLSLNFLSFPSPSGVVATDNTAWTTWQTSFSRVAGVKSIGGPTLGRETLDLSELDIGVGSALAGQVDEQFYVKNKAPGDKDIQPIPTVLNMTHQQYDVLHQAYFRDSVFGFQINFPQGAILIGLGFVQSLEPTIESSKIIEIACEIQPSFGVDYLSNCTGSTVLHNLWRNYLYPATCAAAAAQVAQLVSV